MEVIEPPFWMVCLIGGQSDLRTRIPMPQKRTLARAKHDKRSGKAPTTQAGEFVKEEIDEVRAGKHGVKNTKQAIAIGLSKARRAGVKLPSPKSGSAKTKKQAERDSKRGSASPNKKPNPKRSRAATRALKREGKAPVSKSALSRQAKTASRARRRA